MNQKISELNNLTEIDDADLLPIVDSSAIETKKVNVSDLKSFLNINSPIFLGPGQLLTFSSTLFENSGYTPGVTTTSDPASFGFYSVQDQNFTFNPFVLLGSNKNYRIHAIKRQDGAFNDGLHCMIRKVENNVETGIPGLLDFGSGINNFSSATSDILNSGTSDSFIWFRCYFAAYNGGNGATLQDLTLYIIKE